MFYWTGAHRSIHVRSHSFPTRRASDLRKSRCRPASCATWPSYSWAVSSDGSRPDFSPCSSRSSAVCDRDFGDDLMTAELPADLATRLRSEEHTSELQSLMSISYAVFCLKTTTTIPYY